MLSRYEKYYDLGVGYLAVLTFLDFDGPKKRSPCLLNSVSRSLRTFSSFLSCLSCHIFLMSATDISAVHPLNALEDQKH